jgi:hypothetical protein
MPPGSCFSQYSSGVEEIRAGAEPPPERAAEGGARYRERE